MVLSNHSMAFPPLPERPSPTGRPFWCEHPRRNSPSDKRRIYSPRMPRFDFFANWSESDDVTVVKVRKAIRNNWRKLRTGSTCCGNHGEPGC